MIENVMENPDRAFVKGLKKRIKANSGYCPNCPKTEDWRCPCKAFRELKEGWCEEALYYKQPEEEV